MSTSFEKQIVRQQAFMKQKSTHGPNVTKDITLFNCREAGLEMGRSSESSAVSNAHDPGSQGPMDHFIS